MEKQVANGAQAEPLQQLSSAGANAGKRVQRRSERVSRCGAWFIWWHRLSIAKTGWRGKVIRALEGERTTISHPLHMLAAKMLQFPSLTYPSSTLFGDRDHVL